MTGKTDNHDPRAKLELRRYMLRKYHADKLPDVLDCCQGGGVLWRKLREEFAVSSYWGLDLKPKKGRLKLDSVRVLAQSGWPQNVVDVDTYGSPWRHWEAMLPNVTRPVTVFLTIGRGGPNMIRLGRQELLAMGMTIPRVHQMSGAITHRLAEIAVRYCLAMACESGIIQVEAVEAVSDGNARYIGVRLEPRKTNGQPVPGLCPLCRRPATPSGEADGRPLYSCETCTVQRDLLGTAETVALLFVQHENLAVDPVSLEPIAVKP